MINFEQLYRQVIMDNYKNPANKGLILSDDYLNIHLKNPSCGDDIKVSVKIVDDQVVDIRHDGVGCSICCSSASVASKVLREKSKEEAIRLINLFLDMVKGEDVEVEDLDEAMAYKTVCQFPARIKCATLSWKAILEALEK